MYRSSRAGQLTMSQITDAVDAVVSLLNAHSFSKAFTAVKSYQPDYTMKNLATLKVTVTPRAIAVETISRGKFLNSIQIDVAVQQKPAQLANTDLEALLDLVGEIVTYLSNRDLATTPACYWTRTENDPIYAPEHLTEFRSFTSVITLTYKVVS